MALLKKIRAATLLETIIASVIVLIIFTIGSLSLNNVFHSVIKHNTSPFENRIKEVTYFAKNKALLIPFYEETLEWDIIIEKRETKLYLEAIYKPTEEKKVKILNVEN